MHAGYGIGGLLAVQISKPFIKFDSKTLNTTTHQLVPDDISIKTPYFIAATTGLVLIAFFVLAQLVETRNRKAYLTRINKNSQENASLNQKQQQDQVKNETSFIENLFFSGKVFKGKALCYMYTQISLITIMFFFLAGYISIISKFLLTYLTKGPAQMTIEAYTTVQTLYWTFYVLARFATAILAFRINPVVFLGILFLANTVVCGLFLVVPYLSGSVILYWIGTVSMGITSGPMHPASFMAAKKLLVDYNMFTMSVFSIGLAIGGILFQETVGRLLDYYGEAQVVAYLFFGSSLLVFLLFVPISLIYRKFVSLVRLSDE